MVLRLSTGNFGRSRATVFIVVEGMVLGGILHQGRSDNRMSTTAQDAVRAVTRRRGRRRGRHHVDLHHVISIQFILSTRVTESGGDWPDEYHLAAARLYAGRVPPGSCTTLCHVRRYRRPLRGRSTRPPHQVQAEISY